MGDVQAPNDFATQSLYVMGNFRKKKEKLDFWNEFFSSFFSTENNKKVWQMRSFEGNRYEDEASISFGGKHFHSRPITWFSAIFKI